MNANALTFSLSQPDALAVLHELPLAVAIFDPQGQVLFLNEAFAQSYQLSREQMLYQNIRHFSEDAYWRVLYGFEKLRMGYGIEPYESVLHGRHYWVSVRACRDAAQQSSVSMLVCKSDITALKDIEKGLAASNASLKQISERDYLTGILNRRAFDEGLLENLQRIKHGVQQELCLILMDIDDFKQINDRYGHGVGDQLLKQFSQKLAGYVQAEQGQMFCRFGGEEFTLLLPNYDLLRACQLAEQCRVAVQDLSAECASFQDMELSISVGVSHTDQAIPMQTMIDLADQALYQAKRERKNCIYFIQNQQIQRFCSGSDGACLSPCMTS